MTDANGNVLHSSLYGPYGEPFSATGDPQTSFGFTGEPMDANGLVYLRARYYAPGLGVFPNLDSFEGSSTQAISLNRYIWVQGNVANRVDSSGLCPENPEWYDAFGWRCRFLAEGLANRFSGGNQAAYESWLRVLIQKGYGELEALTALGTAADVSGSATQFLDNASIIPGLFTENPAATLQALELYKCQNQGTLGGILATLIAGTMTAPGRPGVGDRVKPGLGIAVLGGILGGFWFAWYWGQSKFPLPKGLTDPMPPLPRRTIQPTVTATPDSDFIYRWGSAVRDLKLTRQEDWATGLSFFEETGRRPRIKFRVSTLQANGYSVVRDGEQPVYLLFTSPPQLYLDANNNPQFHEQGHVTVYLPVQSDWDLWYHQDLAGKGTPGAASPQAVRLFNLKDGIDK